MRKVMMKKSILISLIVVLVSLFFSQDAIYCQRRSKAKLSKFQPGDAIKIEIIEIMETQSSGSNLTVDDDYAIARDGNIFMPLVGRVKVTGHNEDSLIELLKQKYSPYFKEPFITVIPLIRVTLMGAFNKPGSYRIDPNESLWELIDMAGGPKSDCDLNSIKVQRGGQIVIKNLLSSFEEGHSLEEIGVDSGDQIIAKTKPNIGIKEVLDYTRFGISLIILYLQIKNIAG